jgi:ABC-type transporter Mla MlaB component
MTQKSSHIPQETYHRIYWYLKRGVDPAVIAHTLKLPLKAVEHIIERFSEADRPGTAQHAPVPHVHTTGSAKHAAADEDFLDIFLFVKTRYAVLDISGMVTKKNVPKLETELNSLKISDLKAVALSLADVKVIDEDGLAALISFHEEYRKAGRSTAVLDPSPSADSFITEHDKGKRLPVFGTETAFEAYCFR